MAHLLAPKPKESRLPVFFNVDGHVGTPPAENKSEDVLLVQFAFHVLARATKFKVRPQLRSAAMAVSMTGVSDQATLNAIREDQLLQKEKSPGATVDCRVSPARSYSYGQGLWQIVRLNKAIQEEYTDLWPRIDRIPVCPPALKAMVKREVIGV